MKEKDTINDELPVIDRKLTLFKNVNIKRYMTDDLDDAVVLSLHLNCLPFSKIKRDQDTL